MHFIILGGHGTWVALFLFFFFKKKEVNTYLQYQATREVLKNHHPDASAYFKREKYKLLVPSSAAGSE